MSATRYLLAACWVLLTLTGCKKEEPIETCPGDCTVIKGRLLTANGAAPIANVPLVVKWVRQKSLFGGDLRKKAVATTDGAGHFELSFYVKDDELAEGYFTVEYTVDKSRYYDLGSNFSFQELPRDTTIVQDYLIPRKAYLKLGITNPNALAGHSYWTTFSSPYGQLPCPVSSGRGAGPAISWPLAPGMANPIEVPGDQPMVVTHAKNTSGTSVFSYDTLTVPAGSTRDYIVTF